MVTEKECEEQGKIYVDKIITKKGVERKAHCRKDVGAEGKGKKILPSILEEDSLLMDRVALEFGIEKEKGGKITDIYRESKEKWIKYVDRLVEESNPKKVKGIYQVLRSYRKNEPEAKVEYDAFTDCFDYINAKFRGTEAFMKK